MTKEARCEQCGKVFIQEDDEGAREEAKQIFGRDTFERQEMALVCDECYEAFMEWWRKNVT